MRNAFADEIFQIARRDPRIVLLSGDIGNRLFDRYKAELPDRFYNCGVAEANMISMAAGLAATGFLPVCYTIAPFVTTRCLEQIKVDVCYHEMPVVIVGTGAGLSYASLGSTHHSFEEISALRALPGMRIIAPSDANELRPVLRHVFIEKGPAYVRIGKKGEPLLNPPEIDFRPARWTCLREGGALALLACGPILVEALGAADILSGQGVSVAVWNCSCVKPLDEAILLRLAGTTLITLEEHSVLGGFGAAVAEFVAEKVSGSRVIRCGIPDRFLHDCGEQDMARRMCGLDARSVADRALEALR